MQNNLKDNLNLLANDLDDVTNAISDLWERLRNQTIFITGGTGFFGTWLLESFVWANKKFILNSTAVVLTRNKEAFSKKAPHLFQDAALRFHEGDVTNFAYPEEKFSHIIHAATEASMDLIEKNPLRMFDTITNGTKHVLEFAQHCKAKQILFVSSGAVYGKQPSHLTHITEEDPCQLNMNDSKAVYAIGKCAAEHLCSLYAKQYGLAVKIARCFAFVGPHLPLDIHFAIGNFIRDGLNGQPILIKGDGFCYRSYLYAAELTIWLWTILFLGQSNKPYNVGSDEDFTLRDVAKIVANYFQQEVVIMKSALTGELPERYVPNIARVREELKLTPKIKLADAIKKTIQWHLLKQKQTSMVVE